MAIIKGKTKIKVEVDASKAWETLKALKKEGMTLESDGVLLSFYHHMKARHAETSANVGNPIYTFAPNVQAALELLLEDFRKIVLNPPPVIVWRTDIENMPGDGTPFLVMWEEAEDYSNKAEEPVIEYLRRHVGPLPKGWNPPNAPLQMLEEPVLWGADGNYLPDDLVLAWAQTPGKTLVADVKAYTTAETTEAAPMQTSAQELTWSYDHMSAPKDGSTFLGIAEVKLPTKASSIFVLKMLAWKKVGAYWSVLADWDEEQHTWDKLPVGSQLVAPIVAWAPLSMTTGPVGHLEAQFETVVFALKAMKKVKAQSGPKFEQVMVETKPVWWTTPPPKIDGKLIFIAGKTPVGGYLWWRLASWDPKEKGWRLYAGNDQPGAYTPGMFFGQKDDTIKAWMDPQIPMNPGEYHAPTPEQLVYLKALLDKV